MKSTALTLAALLIGALFASVLITPASATTPSCVPQQPSTRTFPKPCPSVSISVSASTSTSASASSSVSASASASKSYSKSPSLSATPAITPAGGTGAGLPVTGPRVGWLVGLGFAVLFVGAYLFVAARRRRVVFKP